MVATYFPLAFVYGLTTWAVWVLATIGFGDTGSKNIWWGIQGVSLLGMLFYTLGNISYTVAVFTDPGSPMQSPTGKKKGSYSILPTNEQRPDLDDIQTITVSSTGAPRFCKKCHTPKPDRTHHCSTCKRCVLKMDHHCPWLATCLGLHNYKAFVLFLVYTSLFSWTCFFNSAWWMWKELFEKSGYLEEYAPVNVILLSVIAGIIGLVLTGFTGWHIYLCAKGQTTIEKLEKTRYLSGVRSRVERNRQEQQTGHLRRESEGVAERLQRAGEQILEFHANAVPGATRYEEGEEHASPVPSRYNSTQDYPPYPRHPNTYTDDSRTGSSNDTPAIRALRRTYSTVEADRERERYNEYLDDTETTKLPNAFDLGWRRNLKHLLGPNPLFWALPICNTTGDGWKWEVSSKWVTAQQEVSRERQRRLAAAESQGSFGHVGSVGLRGGGEGYLSYEQDRQYDPDNHRHYHQYDDTHENNPNLYSNSAMSMQTLPQHDRSDATENGFERGRRRQRRDFDTTSQGEVETFEVSSDEDESDDSDSDVGYTNRKDAERGWNRRNRGHRTR